jgi:hypothetical protein
MEVVIKHIINRDCEVVAESASYTSGTNSRLYSYNKENL